MVICICCLPQSLAWVGLEIAECSGINLFQMVTLESCNFLIFSPLPLSSALLFPILSAQCNIPLKISFYDSTYKWAQLCYISLSYVLLVLIISPRVGSIAKYPRYLKQGTWEHKNSVGKKKAKRSEIKCFHIQV